MSKSNLLWTCYLLQRKFDTLFIKKSSDITPATRAQELLGTKYSHSLFFSCRNDSSLSLKMAEATGARVNHTRCSIIALFQHWTSWNINIKPATLAALSLC
jgi:hypothetical protein